MSVAELRRLPPAEKLRVMEILWADLIAGPESLPSPAWHEEKLLETQQDYQEGKLVPLDWVETKAKLLGRFS
jgi:hypothetical protein